MEAHSLHHEGAQDHTYPGLRGDTVITGLTYHQLHDAVLVGFNRARMMPDEADVYQAGANDDIDPVALAQNVCNRMEELQGIFPNTITHGDAPKAPPLQEAIRRGDFDPEPPKKGQLRDDGGSC